MRLKFYKHNRKAILYPNEYLSIIIDGMKQNITRCPHFSRVTKKNDADAENYFKFHVTGIIGAGIGLSLYVDHNEISHNANLNCSQIVDYLLKYKENGGNARKVYIQVKHISFLNLLYISFFLQFSFG
eukprot:Lithocolla_globosa_v1_NODE_1735_length_2372_cov_21.738455.p2 type:complete len:128 gc:universal NODE_1735_length_2372_cov_21.738455:273-656(+)